MGARKPPEGNRPLKTLERVLSKAGVGSRKDARRIIGEGRVAVNAVTTLDPDTWVDLERDRVTVDGASFERIESTYILLNKPAGYLTTLHDPAGRPTIYDLLPASFRKLRYVGRLDRDTSGLLILTNDHRFAERVTNPMYHVPRVYEVQTAAPVAEASLDSLRDGIELDDGPTRPAVVERIDTDRFRIAITEGRYRQVRRMVKAAGAEVATLTRIAIGAIRDSELKEGAHRSLTEMELRALVSGLHD